MDQEVDKKQQQQFEEILCSQHQQPINSINVDPEEMAKLVCSICQKQGKYILTFDEADISLKKLCNAETHYSDFLIQITAFLDTLYTFEHPCFDMVEKVKQVQDQLTNYKNQLASNPSLETMLNILKYKDFTEDTLKQIALYLSNQLKNDKNIINFHDEQIQIIETQIKKLYKEINDLSFQKNKGVDFNFASNVTQEQYLDISNNYKLIAFSQILNSDMIELYSVEAKALIFKYYPGESVTFLRFSPDNKLLAASLKTSFDIVLYNVKNLNSIKPIRRLKGHKNILYSLEFLKDSQLIFTGGLDHKVFFWNIKNRKRIFKKHFKTIVLSIEISPDKKYFLVHSFKQISLFKFSELSEKPIQWEVDESTYLVKFNLDSNHLIVYSNVDKLRLFNLQTFIRQGLTTSLWTIKLEYEYARQQLRIVGTLLITFGKNIKVYNMKNGAFLVEFPMLGVEQKDQSYERFCYEDLQLYAVTTDMKQITKKIEFKNQKVQWSYDQLEIIDLFENLMNQIK